MSDEWVQMSEAIWEKDWPRVRRFILDGAEDDISGYDYKDYPLIFRLMDKGQEDLAILWLKHGYPMTARGGRRKEGILQYAAAHGLVRLVKMLISCGADINREDESGKSPLWEAARHGHSECARLLLRAGADPDGFESRPEEDDGWPIYKDTPLGVAANREIARLLLEEGASLELGIHEEFEPQINKRFNLGDESIGALTRACMEGRMDTARALMLAGASLDDQVLRFMAGGDGRVKERDIMEVIAAGADPDGLPGREPLLIAALAGKRDFCSSLLKAGARPLPEALELAVLSGKADCALFFMEEGIGNPDAALRLAARWKHDKLMDALMENSGANRAYALFGAIEGSRWDLAASLLKQGLDVNDRDENGKTPLMALFELDRRKSVWEAIRNFPKRYQAKWQNGRFPGRWPKMNDFDFALAWRESPQNWIELVNLFEEDVMELARELVERGAHIEARDNMGRSALWQACKFCYLKSIVWLTGLGASLYERDNEGKSAFEIGCLSRDCRTISVMLESGYEIDSQDGEGDTALLRLGRQAEEYDPCIFFLLYDGANPDLENRKGESFRKLAQENSALKEILARVERNWK